MYSYHYTKKYTVFRSRITIFAKIRKIYALFQHLWRRFENYVILKSHNFKKIKNRNTTNKITTTSFTNIDTFNNKCRHTTTTNTIATRTQIRIKTKYIDILTIAGDSQ